MNGQQHERLTLGFLLASTPLVGAGLNPEGALAYLGAGSVSILLLSPDLDLDSSRASKRWGVLSVFWTLYWMTHPHRGASHSWVYGPLSRLLYVLLLAGLPLMALGVDVPQMLAQAVKAPWFFPAMLGYLVAQWAHLVQDGVAPRIV